MPASVAAAPVEEAASVRTAAQWLTVAAGAIAAVLVAGLQLGDLGKLSDRPPQLVIAVATFLAALFIAGRVIAKASAVLVVRRITISDLLEADITRQLTEKGFTVGGVARLPRSRGEATKRASVAAPPVPPRRRLFWRPPASSPQDDLSIVLEQIRINREWLLLEGQTSARDLHADFTEAASRARAGDQAAIHESSMLEQRLTAVCAFARTELTRLAYRRLKATITGWPGWIFAISVVAFSLALSVSVSQDPSVQSPYNVTVILTGNTKALHDAGLPDSCKAPTPLSGVAVAGSLTEPEVVTKAGPGCPPARFTVSKRVGIPIPEIK